jgi:hypothetical protein
MKTETNTAERGRPRGSFAPKISNGHVPLGSSLITDDLEKQEALV